MYLGVALDPCRITQLSRLDVRPSSSAPDTIAHLFATSAELSMHAHSCSNGH